MTVVLVLGKHWTTATQLFKMPTRPYPALPLAKLSTTPFCLIPSYRQKLKTVSTRAKVYSMLTNWNPCFKIVLIT